MLRLFLAAALGATLSTPALAQVNRCKGADGKITYSDLPCPAAAQATQIKVRPAYRPEPGREGRADDATARMLRAMEEERTFERQRQLERERREASAADNARRRKYWDQKDCSRYQQYVDEARLKQKNGGTVADLEQWKIDEKTWAERIKRECG